MQNASAAPMISAVAMTKGLDSFIVRKTAKEHGRGLQIEGGPVERDHRVLMVEDVVTTGGSLFKAIDAVESRGAHVSKIVALVDRGGGQALRDAGHLFQALYTVDEVLA